LKQLGKINEAYDAFYKSTWSTAWQDSGFFSVAQIDIAREDYENALEHLQLSLNRNAQNSKAYVLKVVALRKLEQYQAALKVCNEALKRDGFNLAIYLEQNKIYQALNNAQAAQTSLGQYQTLARDYVQNYIEYALDYAVAGLCTDAIESLNLFVDKNEEASVYPMVWYYLGWLHYQSGNTSKAQTYFEKGAKANPDYCFPNRFEDIPVLQLVAAINARDAKAPYYLGNLWYDKRQYEEAIEQWELSVERDHSFPTVLRNLGIAYFNKKEDHKKALACYEKAFQLNASDARILMELDQLYKRLNRNPSERLQFLEQHSSVVEQRDDLYLERTALYNFLGEHEKAYQQIMQRRLHPWEGGEGKVSGQYIYSLIEMAKEHIQSARFQKAVELLEQAQVYPDNLGEGKLFGAQENDIFYWLGVAYEGMGDEEQSKVSFIKATNGLSEPAAAMFYNDQQPDKIFYKGLAWSKLGKEEKANQIFSKLVAYGQTHLDDEVKIDYFAVSLPDLLIFEDNLNIRNQIHCYYMMGLGYLGLSNLEKAKEELKQALQQDVMHFGCKTHLRLAMQLKERVTT
jgi:tetratricopeptide (TPR) repeat protein